MLESASHADVQAKPNRSSPSRAEALTDEYTMNITGFAWQTTNHAPVNLLDCSTKLSILHVVGANLQLLA